MAGRKFASTKNALGICDRCGRTYKLKKLKKETVNLVRQNLMVCPSCFDPDHPQLQVGRRQYADSQTLRSPRPDSGEVASTIGASTVSYDFTTGRDFFYGTAPFVSQEDSEGVKLLRASYGFALFSDQAIRRDSGSSSQILDIDADALKVINMRVRQNYQEHVGADPYTYAPIEFSGRFKWGVGGPYVWTVYPTTMPSLNSSMGDQWSIASWDLTDEPLWTGTVTSVEFELFTNVSSIDIDYIRFESKF